jgi:hypothetical protein
MKKRRYAACLVLLVLVLNSCIGVSADISIREDGSGKIVLEYRVSPMLEALGRLDGNERWQTNPAGRADFERTRARLPDLRLVSFSSKNESGGDVVNRAELEFKNIESLPAFLDGRGNRAAFIRENGKNRLSLTLLDATRSAAADAELLGLVREVCRGYELRLSLSAPKTASLVMTPNDIPAAKIVSPGKKVSLSIETGELLSLPGGLGVELIW